MKNKARDAEHAHKNELAVMGDELAKLKVELTLVNQQLNSVEAERAKQQQTAAHSDSINAAEINALKAEVDGYKESVKKLETHIDENYEHKILKERNDTLQAQITSLKNQLTHANTTLASLRIEADISESYRIKLIQEQVESQIAKISALEKERRYARPLLQDLVDLVQRKDLVDPALSRDIDRFYRQFGHTAPAVDD